MQIVGIVSGDFVRTGGMDMPNFALAKRCSERQIETHVVAYRIASELEHAGSHLTFHRVKKPLNSYLAGSTLLDLAGRKVARSVLGRSGARMIVNGGNCQAYDVNWVHYVHAAFRPFEQTRRPFRAAKNALARSVNLKRERAALRGAQLLIVNSQRTKQHLIDNLGIDPSRARVVHYGIDPDRFRPASAAERTAQRVKLGLGERRQVAFVGALGDRRKGFDTLFGAWQRLCQTPSWDCDLLVVGHGAELASWEKRAQSAGLAQRVRFLGFRRDVPDVLQACDALAAPARYEAFGLGVQEALCMGLPAIVSAAAGVAELYTGDLRELLLGDPESEAELAARLVTWRERAEQLQATARDTSARLRQRTWDVMADEIITLLS